MSVFLTHGAKKNVGDYLIHSRARKLWRQVRPDLTIESIARWEHGVELEDTSLLVMCGGPGLTNDLVEKTFPIIEAARRSGARVSGFALGWSGQPWHDPMAFQLSETDLNTLKAITEASGPLSVRDDLTKQIADNLGVPAVMTGCAAWYSLEHMGKSANSINSTPKSIVFTTAAHRRNTLESIRVMKWLRQKFPRARIYASFHRGIGPDSETSALMSAPLTLQARAARYLGLEVVDTSYSLENIDFYKDADFHIGYRVHAHLDFLSRRTPSMLIAEDGRGTGQILTLDGDRDPLIARSRNFLKRLNEKVDEQVNLGWPSLDTAIEKIETTYPVMRASIEAQARGI